MELLVGATLSAAVMAAVFSSYIYLGRSLARLANQQTLETEARRTLGQFTQDVQMASGIVTISTYPTSPAANRVDLTLPTDTTANTITYYYNSDLTDSTSVSFSTPSGTSTAVNVTMPAASLTRCVNNGATVTSLTLLRNITDGDTDESDNDLKIHFYDSSGTEYTSYTDYLPGIKQLALKFSTQLGNSANGTRTQVHQIASSRVILRNRGFLQ